MRCLFLYFSLFTFAHSYGQANNDKYLVQAGQFCKAFFEHQIRRKGTAPTVVMQSVPFKLHPKGVSMSENFIFNPLISRFDSGECKKVYTHLDSKGSYADEIIDSLEFSEIERKEILGLLKGEKPLLWSQSLLGDVKLIDTLYLDSVYSEPLEPLYLADPWYSGVYYELSAPLFFRNYTLCVFSWSVHGDEFFGELAVYKRSGDEWIRYGGLWSWER